MQPSDRFCTYIYTYFFAFEDTTLEEESQAKEGSGEESSSVEDSGHMVYVADQVMTWEEAPTRLATFEG